MYSEEDSGTCRIFLTPQKPCLPVFMCAQWGNLKKKKGQIHRASTRRGTLHWPTRSSICWGLVRGRAVSRVLYVYIIYPLNPQTALWRKDYFYQTHFTDKEIRAESPSWIHTILTTGNPSVSLWSGCYCSKFTCEATQAHRNCVAKVWEVKEGGYEFQSTSFHSAM